MKRKRKGFATANKKNRQRRKSNKRWIEIPVGIEFFKEEGGKKYKIDILPYIVKDVKNHPDGQDIPEDLWWRYPYKIHRNIGPNKDAVICPGTVGKACPICEERQAIYDDPEGDNDDAKALKASNRGLYVVREVKKKKTEPMIWDISDFCFLDQLDQELDDGPEEWEDFAAPEGGYSLQIRFEEKQIGDQTFGKANRIDFEERKDITDEEIESFPCLDDCITIPTYEQVKAIFEGEEQEEDTEEDSENDEEEQEEQEEQEEKEPFDADELTWDELKDMSESDLVDACEKYEIEVDDDWSEDDMKKAIVKELDIEIPKEKKRKKKTKKNKKEEKAGCPFGHKFGEDFEETDDCDEEKCEKYDACFDRYEELD